MSLSFSVLPSLENSRLPVLEVLLPVDFANFVLAPLSLVGVVEPKGLATDIADGDTEAPMSLVSLSAGFGSLGTVKLTDLAGSQRESLTVSSISGNNGPTHRRLNHGQCGDKLILTSLAKKRGHKASEANVVIDSRDRPSELGLVSTSLFEGRTVGTNKDPSQEVVESLYRLLVGHTDYQASVNTVGIGLDRPGICSAFALEDAHAIAEPKRVHVSDFHASKYNTYGGFCTCRY